MGAEHADETMKVMHALHNPDFVAGGNDKITDVGDGQVTSTIGGSGSVQRKGEHRVSMSWTRPQPTFL
ncbi:hypothetical protein G9274_003333 [Stenotrophomonas rhizophila]|nr:hypothetical protein G9274_003333 [Stenotrophomonas rhizophila]